MLRKIPVPQLRRGMFLHAVEGSWMSHSMWKTRFLIEDDAELAKLRESGAAEVVIDTGRGLDVVVDAPVVAAAAPQPATPAAPVRTSMVEELRQAEQIRERARVVVTSMFNDARLGKSFDAESCAPLVTDIVDSVHRNRDALVSLSRLKLADEYTYLHSVAVCALMVSLGRELGLDEKQCHEAGMAGLMHDLGKARIPLDVLNKPGKLTDDEFQIVREHPVRGYQMLVDAGVTSEAVLTVCRNHHERMDGKGYPDRLQGDQLSTLVRMSAICDVYDAVTSDRVYKRAWNPAEAIAQMASWKGHFDETVLKAFIRSLGIYPTGSLVRLASGRLAVVAGQNPARLTEPRVRVFFSTNAGAQLPPTILDLHAPGCEDRIIGRESPADWPFKDLDRLWLDAPEG